jgi:hypothetical protein
MCQLLRDRDWLALAIDDFTFSGTDAGGTPTATPGATPSPTAIPTATPLPASPTTGAIIGEYRLSGPSGPGDEFIEIYNQDNTSLDLTVRSVVQLTITTPSSNASSKTS